MIILEIGVYNCKFEINNKGYRCEFTVSNGFDDSYLICIEDSDKKLSLKEEKDLIDLILLEGNTLQWDEDLLLVSGEVLLNSLG